MIIIHPSTTMTQTMTGSPFYLLSLSNMLDLIRCTSVHSISLCISMPLSIIPPIPHTTLRTPNIDIPMGGRSGSFLIIPAVVKGLRHLQVCVIIFRVAKWGKTFFSYNFEYCFQFNLLRNVAWRNIVFLQQYTDLYFSYF